MKVVIQAEGILGQLTVPPAHSRPWAKWLVRALQHHATVTLLIGDDTDEREVKALLGGVPTCTFVLGGADTIFLHDPSATKCSDVATCIHVDADTINGADSLLTVVVPGLPPTLCQKLFTTPGGLPAPRLDIERKPITAESFNIQHDPKIFCMHNGSSVCYINALVQGILRCHTWTRHYDGKPVVDTIGDRIEKALGANRQHDVHEGLMVITDDVIYTPSPKAFPPSPPDPSESVARSTSSVAMATRDADVWCMTIIPSVEHPSAQGAMEAAFEAREDIGNDRYLQLEKPSAATKCMILHVSRNINAVHGKSKLPVVASRTIAVPTDEPGKFTLMGLRAMVVHMGQGASFGHYATLFFRDDGRAWWASDRNVLEIQPQQLENYLRGQPAQNNALLMYDVVAPKVL